VSCRLANHNPSSVTAIFIAQKCDRYLCLQADKLSITQELGIQVRDLRLLDPAMATSYPSAILCRDKALLVNMEHIKCIITTHYLLLLNADQPSVLQFAEDIQFRLAHATHAHRAKAKAPPSTKAQKKGSHMRVSKSDSDLETYLLINGSDSSNTSSVSHKSYQDTPFELKALEAVLDMVLLLILSSPALLHCQNLAASECCCANASELLSSHAGLRQIVSLDR